MISKTPARHCLLALGCMVILFSETSCSKSSDDTTTDVYGDWSRASDFEGVARTEAISFTIGDTAYIGSGYDRNNRLSDCWGFDPATGTWTQKADMPGVARSSASAFSVNGKGYVGTGYDGINKLKDFYEYDPATNSWTQKAAFGGSSRYDATAFSINGKGYISCGFDGNHLKDLWEYDPTTDQWLQKSSLGGTKRSGASSFVLGNNAYVVGGINNGSYPDDFWMYDPTTNTWEQKRQVSAISTEDYDDLYTDIARSNAATFVMNNKAFLIGGDKSGILATAWAYDPATDLWIQKTALEASARSGAVGFTVGGIGYIGTGSSTSYRFDDLWKFSPDAEQVANN